MDALGTAQHALTGESLDLVYPGTVCVFVNW